MIAYMVAPRIDWPAYGVRVNWVGELPPRWEMNITASLIKHKQLWKETLQMGRELPSIQTAVAASSSSKEAILQVMDVADIRAIFAQIPLLNTPLVHREAVVMERIVHALPRTTLAGVQDGKASLTQFWRLMEAGAMGNSAMSPLQSVLRDGFFDDFRHKLVKEAGSLPMVTDEPIVTVASRLGIGPEDLVLDISACKGRIALHIGLVTGAEVAGVTSLNEYAKVALDRMERAGTAPSSAVTFHPTLDAALEALAGRAPTVVLGLAGDEASGTEPSGEAWSVARSKLAAGGRIAAVKKRPWRRDAGDDAGSPDNLIETTLSLKLAWGQDGRGDANAEVYLYMPDA